MADTVSFKKKYKKPMLITSVIVFFLAFVVLYMGLTSNSVPVMVAGLGVVLTGVIIDLIFA